MMANTDECSALSNQSADALLLLPEEYVDLGTICFNSHNNYNNDNGTSFDNSCRAPELQPNTDDSINDMDVYSNMMEINRRSTISRRSSTSAVEDEFFQHSGTTLDATVDLFHELFPHLATKLSPPSGNNNIHLSTDHGWVERLVAYWNELGIDQSTINITLERLEIGPACLDECDNAVRLLFQRFAEALTGICLAHPCSTVIFLTAFDELKATRMDVSDAIERRRQAESELTECQRRIALLADEADERCRQVDVSAAEKVTVLQQKSASAIAQVRSELDAERNLWLLERESLLNDARRQAELLEKLQKRYNDEVADCSYWKQQAHLLREECNSFENERSQLLLRISNLSGRHRSRNNQGCGTESDSSDSSGETDASVDVRTQLDSQMAINKILTEDIARLKEQLAMVSASKAEAYGAGDISDNNSSSSKEGEPKVVREDSGLGMVDSVRHHINAIGDGYDGQTIVVNNNGVSCFDLLYGNDDWASSHAPFSNEFEALEAACCALASPAESQITQITNKLLIDAEAQCCVMLDVKSCQVDLVEAEECERLRLSVTSLQSNLTESVNAFNSLRSRYHKQLVRSNQLIDLTNQLYAENCRLANSGTTSSSSPSSSSASSTSTPSKSQTHLLHRRSPSPSEHRVKSASSTSKNHHHHSGKCRSSKHEQIYVVVGPPTLAQQVVLR